MALSKNAKKLLSDRYCRGSEQPYDVFKRVAETLSLGDIKFEQKLNKTMKDGIFLPNSPCLRNAGEKKRILHACFVLEIKDTIESLSKSLQDMMIIFKQGGGVGMNFSELRPQNAELSSGGTSSGVVSFMKLYDVATEVVKQGGFRRGALMGVLNFEHAEIIEFIRSKLSKQLTNFNISVLVSDKFMEKVEKNESIDLINPNNNEVTNTINAKTIFDIICFCAWNSGDPGLLFYDRINKDNPYYPKLKIKATNPCVTGDTLIAVADGRNAISIKQLIEEEQDVPIYCQDVQAAKNGKKKIVIKWGRNPRMTRKNQKVYKVILDDGSYVKATGDHQFMLRDGKYKKLLDLQVGDSLMPFNTEIQNGYVTVNSNGNYWKRQFRMIWEFMNNKKQPKGFHIHHKDFNKLNDTLSNLDLISIEEHKKIHDISGDKNPMRKWYKNATKEEKLRYHINMSKAVSGIKNGRAYKISNADLLEMGVNLVKEKNRIFTKLEWEEFASKNSLPLYFNNFRRKRFGRVRDFARLCAKSAKVEDFNHKRLTKNLLKHFAINNHKVKRIEFAGYEDVYNLTVDDNHNYMVVTNYKKDNSSTGICVRNCGETPLLPYMACCLGSINLSKLVKYNKFDFKLFERYLKIATRALRNMNVVSYYPLPEITKAMKEYDPIGVGIMGFADALIKMNIYYDSQEALDFIDEIGKAYKKVTDNLAKGCFYKRIIAPTGSLSILANCSSGIEPVFAADFERHLTVGVLRETRELYKSKYLRIAHDIEPIWHLKIQAKWQEQIDGSVSKTINLPNNASVDDVKNIYMNAWKMKVKGITVFRDGSKGTQVLNIRKEDKTQSRNKCEGESCQL